MHKHHVIKRNVSLGGTGSIPNDGATAPKNVHNVAAMNAPSLSMANLQGPSSRVICVSGT
jgi:hypothetical protein